MKAIELLEQGNELNHKLRTVSDLIRHIKTRESDSETPNYNLFFGAGCSVTSGIRQASQLTQEWALDLYERLNNKQTKNPDEAIEYLQKYHSKWYNKENSYSSLFEKTYEFPIQRRRFVEGEVDGALPAIGYAYLTSLVQHRYFNTVFTTNFDDLINEAFYQFSNERPIVCAHDSSINSISITSKRPKIIKLHGDYLFDDIKSTLRETESLEQNIKDKLVEFCKEFGLIVVGYSGNDRSIMDVLDFLTNQESYLKNGVYWCLRSSDYVNHSLQNLFWRDKVYPVIIDGFDELFAEFHSKLTGSGLDFENNLKNSKLQQIKKNILDHSGDLVKNDFIREDIQKIKDANNKQEISDFLSSINSSDEDRNLSLSELRNLLEIEDLLKKEEHHKAFKIAEDLYYSSESDRVKKIYISMLIRISKQRDDKSSCRGWCDKLLDIDPHNSSYIIRRSKYFDDPESGYTYLLSKSKEYPYSTTLKNALVSSGLRLLQQKPLTTTVRYEELSNIADNSLKLTPSLSNSAWNMKLDLLDLQLKEIRKQNLEKEATKHIKTEIEELISRANNINESHLTTIELRITELKSSQDEAGSKKIINEMIELHKKSDAYIKTKIDLHIQDVLDSFKNFEHLVDNTEVERSFYERHISDKDIESVPELLLGKCEYYISHGNQVDKAKTYFSTALNSTDIIHCMRRALLMNKCFDSAYTDSLEKIIENQKHAISDWLYYDFKSDLYLSRNDYSRAIEFEEKAYLAGMTFQHYFEGLSYLHLMSGQYEKLIDIANSKADEIEKVDSEILKVNLQFARKRHDGEFDELCMRNLTAKTSDQKVRLGAFAVLGQEKEVKRIVKELIKHDFMNYHLFNSWPILESAIIEEVRVSIAA
jgi:hypothetical protein